MKTIYSVFLFILAFNCRAQNSNIISSDATLEKLSGGFSFTEGPASDVDGNVYFTDQPNDRIMKWSTDDILTAWMKPSGRSNGLSFDDKGNLWSCADENNQLWKITPDKEVEIILKGYENKLLNGPNDLWISLQGGVYFTDPYYQRPWWSHKKMPQDVQCVYYLPPYATRPVRIAEDLVQPNGIIGTPDGSILYITDIGGKKTWSYRINDDGHLSDKKLFCEMGSDGMTLDDKGNLYLTNKGVFIFNRKGEQIYHIEVPEPWTANVCFGGKNMDYLFITASKGLYRIKTNVRGVGSQ